MCGSDTVNMDKIHISAFSCTTVKTDEIISKHIKG